MRSLFTGLTLLIVFGTVGCSKSKTDEGEMPPPKAPINNNAPGASTAGAAPTDPSVPKPGLKGGRK